MDIDDILSSVCQDSELARLCKAREQELNYKKEMDRLEVEKQQKLAEIESQRFKQLMENLGTDTLKEMARAGPELQVSELKNIWMANEHLSMGAFASHFEWMWRVNRLYVFNILSVGYITIYLTCIFFFLQVKLLQSLGLKSTLITDGSSPINLFTTANGLLGALQGKDKDE